MNAAPTSTEVESKPKFMLFLRHPHGEDLPPTPQELEVIMGRFKIWMDDMEARGHVIGTNGLDTNAGRVLRGTMVMDGPLIEAKEIVGGYVMLTAENLDQAAILAGACPGLEYGMTLEVRPVVACCGAASD
ncbi:hypothetical protein DES53_109268 [Roseimicrobium gellanilyticum]|uniref:YCII-related domain-containing protein n=1 Tax=Roseimicrobium gellanilyticum TaxID=748857 RepID=A0A366HCY2_9BACT|nr:YciI family protein [Roseimicrobium gellanilyticum]RBP39840.1 hypothetical protein DES53_109268 [Roseimicrobium gellanilyticum]